MHWPLIKNLPPVTNFRFVQLAPYLAVVSILLVLGSGVSYFTKGMNLGIDFAGGVAMEVHTPTAIPKTQLQEDLLRFGAHDPSVVSIVGDPNSAMLRFRAAEGQDLNTVGQQVAARLKAEVPGLTIKRQDVIGSQVSKELLWSGLEAMGLALGLMLLYIWFRFQLQFGFGAVLAVLHDIVLTIGMLSFLQIEFSLTTVAGLLTVIGYSMNEKVITFDRLRENLRKYKVTPLGDLINLSENERLSRTIITGSTALLALGGMLFLGGPALFPLVFTMVFGIFIGTYSSVYVALPLILLWGVKRGDEDATPIKLGPARY
ncbi:preprotein translocase subunit SecF [Caulobacter ginsengisoli]|uniref:Protein-export membrane protein SecF n=1 Tax=Caulobacter ginsengisoli TaxID=400775 RepID=A0ABU0IP83_9CAUL|nr:protein translocase subunit SecF [Caulobacter ginsengisoli]MDQ0463818.1 preprotein translocase subunit SecF [Caulobacter ginsengisoli]